MKYRHRVLRRKNSFFSLKLKLFFLFIFVLIIIFSLSNSSIRSSQISENILGFNISSDIIISLFEFSQKYNKDFPEMLLYYSLENNENKNKIENDDKIEQNFIMNYDNIKNNYDSEEVKLYYDLISDIYNDIKCFPVDNEYWKECIYGDSWGAERTYGGKRQHKGCDIMDRENIRGRIPIVSMSNGIVENIGWNEKGGYRIGIRSESGIYFYYAHFNSYYPNIQKGKSIKAGDIIGYMGDTGYSNIEGTTGNFEVHLHVGIDVSYSRFEEEKWVNPFPFLRLIQYKTENYDNNQNISIN